MFINPTVLNNLDLYRDKFENAQPFKYIVIENFLQEDLAQKLLDEFPVFDPQKALNELGYVGGKAVHENMKEISTLYAKFAHYVCSKEFLNVVSQITGIEKLIGDETFFGGGTHENLHGQDLDAHVDFNYDERRWLHRRLNLIIFLNHEWDDSWGGLLELHSNPRDPDYNQVTAFAPLFNRCVLFETNEYSWHGFPRINIPEDKRYITRKSLSIYLYSKDRPQEEIAPPHATFYINRPLPAQIQEGNTLTTEDYQAIRNLLQRRDDMIEFYQKRELKESAEKHKYTFSSLPETHEELRKDYDNLLRHYHELQNRYDNLYNSKAGKILRILSKVKNKIQKAIR
ncbi:proline hydroxylase [Aphanothece hegewaldii CCALA 016]|uniref:Proline hydroxylase n=1 Tax=Aphanothece hegewaldii CCALA 016 TaxID=2107694 RepID=A0A2T1LYI9_9CHRO|nr:2OG-Fe(II) oxygenase [Aphanothece hegewaldii]PSF37431.1 proline hydroxylase [Aphanothece hegewaldii CCALA 016]